MFGHLTMMAWPSTNQVKLVGISFIASSIILIVLGIWLLSIFSSCTFFLFMGAYVVCFIGVLREMGDSSCITDNWTSLMVQPSIHFVGSPLPHGNGPRSIDGYFSMNGTPLSRGCNDRVWTYPHTHIFYSLYCYIYSGLSIPSLPNIGHDSSKKHNLST